MGKNLILLGRCFLGAVQQFDSRVDAGIYSVSLLVRVVHKWLAVMYKHSKLKLSFNQIPQYLWEPGGWSWELGAEAGRPWVAGMCLLFGVQRRVHLKVRGLAAVDKLDNGPGLKPLSFSVLIPRAKARGFYRVRGG
jgi:hypothetical protein